jgi:SAM-dependent methyltransferase
VQKGDILKAFFQNIKDNIKNKLNGSKNKVANVLSVSKKEKRRRFIEDHIDISSAKILEIGAFNDPGYFKKDVNVFFMDWFSKEELYANHKQTKPDRVKNIVGVDFVVKDKYFEKHITQKYDLVIANHVIEHIPDVISWLQSAFQILKKNGLLFLSVPHKEYTFDKIRPLTTLGQLIENNDQDLHVPTFRHVFDHIYLYRPIRASNVWDGTCADLLKRQRFSAKEAIRRTKSELSKNDYVDVHCHVFDYDSFLKVCNDLLDAEYIDFNIAGSKDVVQPENEFFIMLRKL